MENLPNTSVLLFSYGTLQDKAVQLGNLGRELSGRPDAIAGYPQTLVAIDDAEVVATSGKTHHPVVQPSSNPEDEVRGTVFEGTVQELATADEYEVSEYKRVLVLLRSGAQPRGYVRARSIASFAIAIFRPRLAEYVMQSVRKGSHVLIEGSLISSTFERAKGKGKKAGTEKITSWSIRAHSVRKLDRGEPEPEVATPSAEESPETNDAASL